MCFTVAPVRQEILRYRWKKSIKAFESKMRQSFLEIKAFTTFQTRMTTTTATWATIPAWRASRVSPPPSPASHPAPPPSQSPCRSGQPPEVRLVLSSCRGKNLA